MQRSTRVFSYEEALASLPEVHSLTRAAVSQVEAIFNRVQSRAEARRRQKEIEQAIDDIVGIWSTKIAALGCEAKGLWLVDWDNGDGYYCWRYPEETIAHVHSYDEGFAGRVPIN